MLMRNLSIFLTVFFNTFGSMKVDAESLTRTVVMSYKLIGNIDTQLDTEHKNRLKMADTTLRQALQATGKYDLVDESSAKTFSEKVTSALDNNACDHCESTLAKQFGAKLIIAPYVYRLSQLVLTMHFVIIDADSGKTVLKKALDFRGDNDQSWQRATLYFVKYVSKP
jgi:Protein of unknown function (DUF2380)